MTEVNMQDRLNDAYHQRNMLVLLAAKFAIMLGLDAGWGFDKKPDWEDEWCYVVYVDLPEGGQVSYHLAPSEVELFKNQLPQYESPWDGSEKTVHHKLIEDLEVVKEFEAMGQALKTAETNMVMLAHKTEEFLAQSTAQNTLDVIRGAFRVLRRDPV